MVIQVSGFDIESEIGRGGFGVVYRARQLAFDRPAAIKVLLPNSSAEELARRFAQECRAVGALRSHPHVVTVYSTGTTTDGLPYLAMEYLGGGSLRARIPLPVDTVVALGMKLADGLSAAHAGGVIHRDVKPANVLFDADDEPVLVDFGISSLVGDASLTGDDVALSLGYTPPEMFEGGRATPSVDVYSLGATLFAALTGRTPFVSGDGYTSIPVLAGRILNQPLEDLRPLGVPDELCRVIETCMAKDPATRFTSTAEVRSALARVGAGDTVRRSAVLPAPPVVTGPAPLPPTRRRRIALATAAVLLLGAGVATAVAVSGDDRQPRPVAATRSSEPTSADGSATGDTTGGPGSSTAGRGTTSAAAGDPGDPNGLGALPPTSGADPVDGTTAGGRTPGQAARPTAGHAVPRPPTTRTSTRTVTAAPPRSTPSAAPQHAPALHAVPIISANETYRVDTRATASDADGGRLTFTVTGLPLGVTASADGVISGTIATRAATVTRSYQSIRSRRFTVTVTVTDSTGRKATAVRTWTVRDTRFIMPDYRGYRGCNGVHGCSEPVPNVRALGPHHNKCRVVTRKYGHILAQSVRVGAPVDYGSTVTYTVGRKSC